MLVGPEFGISKSGLSLPKGVVSGVQLESVLRGLAKVKGYRKFDELPIPYRAVATDLVTGKAVVFQRWRASQRHARKHVGAGCGCPRGNRRHAAR